MVRNNIMIQEYTEVQALELEPLGLPSISLPNNLHLPFYRLELGLGLGLVRLQLSFKGLHPDLA